MQVTPVDLLAALKRGKRAQLPRILPESWAEENVYDASVAGTHTVGPCADYIVRSRPLFQEKDLAMFEA